MNKKMPKLNYKKIIISTIFLSLLAASAFAGVKEDLTKKLTNVGANAEYKPITEGKADEDAAKYIGQIISYILAMLGVIFLILTIYAGFLWMTAQGDSEVVTKAKDMMTNAIIGLIIVLMSYAITFYVVSKAAKTTTTTLF